MTAALGALRFTLQASLVTHGSKSHAEFRKAFERRGVDSRT